MIRREDGTYAAVAQVAGRTRTFHIVAREAPWTLAPGLTVLAKTYNGVVPGPTLVAAQGDTIVIDYRNELTVPDTIHLHGIHDFPDTMDGVGGISQPLVQPGGRFRYAFVARASGTFIYHTHDNEQMVDSGLYGAIVVDPTHVPAGERVQHDDVEMLSSWMIQSTAENHFTINGKEYPATTPITVTRGQRVRLRWINMSGENFHTMHTHGHYQRIVARDAQPVTYRDVEDTIELGPGQRVDAIVDADAQPGNWLVHCHVLDHIEDDQGMPDGLITEIHYTGTPNTLAAMGTAMRRSLPDAANANPHAPLSFGWTTLLGAIAGLTIFIGLPIARAKTLTPNAIGALNALAIGILVYLVVEIAGNATAPIARAVSVWHVNGGAPPLGLLAGYVGGLLVGLVGLGFVATRLAKHGAKGAVDQPLMLAALIAIGIGAHNFAEGLAIGASAASGATAIAVGLIVGFALHNATEGFGVAAPLAGRTIPSWRQIGLAGLVAGGPTFIGTMVGYTFDSPLLAVVFLTTAVGALIFVIGELWSVLKRTGITLTATSMLAAGFVLAFATELYLDINGG